MTLPGGSVQQASYDALLRPTTIRSEDPAQNAVLNYSYAYDAVGNIDSKTTEHGLYDYGYDDLDRLIRVTAPPGDESFSYDAVGNRLSAANTAGPWSYNANNELQGYDDIAYQYDANGNTTRKTQGGSQQQRFRYDHSDRLIEARDQNDQVIGQYAYDPFGRRLYKEANGTRIYFLYAEEGLIGEYDQSGALIRGYGYEPDSTWTTNPVYLKTATDTYFYQNDHLGTPQQLTDRAGAVVWAATYKSFGAVQVTTNVIENPLRFPGQYEDGETGLYYNYFRFYHPGIGRYQRVDPIGMYGGINVYGYAFSNPIFWIDPFGLDVWRCARPVFDGYPMYPLNHHDYPCVTDRNGDKVCGSTTPKKDGSHLLFPEPARPSGPNDGDVFNPDRCKLVDEEDPWYPDCVENCVIAKIRDPNRPDYVLNPLGTDCWEWTDDTIEGCVKECSRTKNPCHGGRCLPRTIYVSPR